MKITLFQRLKGFINDTYCYTTDRTFTTKQMRASIGKFENLTYWKKFHKNPHYALHCYLGELRTLGCITRVSHGEYVVNGLIPSWFGSMHFKGLKGHLNDKSNLYWNSIPSWQKMNPWVEQEQVRLKDAPVNKPELESMSEKHPANVEGSIDQRIWAMESLFNEQTKRLQDIKNALAELQALADERNQVKLRYQFETVRRVYEVTYLGDEYRVIHTYDADYIHDEYWKVDNYVDNEIDNTEIAEYLIDWVKQNCK